MKKFINNSNAIKFVNKLQTEIGTLDKQLYSKPNFSNPIECEQRAKRTKMQVALENINKGNYENAEILLNQFNFNVE